MLYEIKKILTLWTYYTILPLRCHVLFVTFFTLYEDCAHYGEMLAKA